ncbi:MAG: response regulator [Nitrospiraceae bacterium]|nr:response regulator [Nitrospiraceae bacterium]
MKRILIIDDEETILLSLSHLLRSDSVSVTACGSVEEAAEALSRDNFDLVIADIRLSGVYGIEGVQMLEYIKDTSPGTSVIVMTAYGSSEMKDVVFEKGAFHYFEKPIDVSDLLDKIAACGIPVPAAKGKRKCA